MSLWDSRSTHEARLVLGIWRVTEASRGSSCCSHNSNMCKCHVPQRAKGKKKALVAQMMHRAQELQVLAGREDIKQDDYEGLILFSSRAIMTLTYSWYPVLRSRFWPRLKSRGSEPSGSPGGAGISSRRCQARTRSQPRCHGRLCSVASAPSRRADLLCPSVAPAAAPPGSYCSHVKSGRAAFIRGEIWPSNAAAQQQGSSGFKLRPGRH